MTPRCLGTADEVSPGVRAPGDIGFPGAAEWLSGIAERTTH
jgi:hypothetical protein